MGVVALITTIIALILSFTLRGRQKNDTFVGHGIWMIVAAIFSIICIIWGVMAGSAIKAGRQPMSFLTIFVFIVALFYFGYCIVESMWFVFYRQIHYDYLLGLRTNDAAWNARMPDDQNLEEGYRSSRRLIWWTVFMTLVAAGAFAYIAYAARSVVWNRYQISRYGLYLALAFMILASWIMIYWAEEVFEYEIFYNEKAIGSVARVLKAFAIAGLVFAFINTIINLLKIKLGYFIYAILAIVLLIGVTGATALLWRFVRQTQFSDQEFNNTSNCAVSMQSIHEDDFDDNLCTEGGKYLPAGQTCSKELLVQRWESGNFNEIRSLNPVCCPVAKHYYIWPMMQLAYWGTALALATAVAMGFNFYLSDTSEYLTNANKAIGVGDILGLLVILGLLIAWGIYFLARDKNGVRRYSNFEQLAGFRDPVRNPIPNYQVVPRGLLNQTNPVVSNNFVFNQRGSPVCYNYDTANLPFPTFVTNGTACNNPSTCTVRVAFAVQGASLTATNTNTGAFTPALDNRFVFFPNCANNIGSYLMAYGTIDQVRAYLSGIRICTTNPNIIPTYLFYKDQVAAGSVNNNGITANEAITFAATNQNSSLCATGFSGNRNDCSTFETCRVTQVNNQSVIFRTTKGRLYYIQNGQRRFNVPAPITVTATTQNGTSVGNLYTLFEDGVFVIRNVPRFSQATYVLTLAIIDPTGVFLNKSVDVIVDPSTTGDEISAGEIRLDTKDGRICGFNDGACIGNQTFLNGTINLVATDGSTSAVSSSNNRLGNTEFRLANNFSVFNLPIRTTSTNNNGIASFSNVPYGPYTVIAQRTGYSPSVQLIDLQEPNLFLRPFVLSPSVTDFDAKIIAEMLTPETDYDLILQVRTDRNANCEVSPYNKYCAYAAHQNDIVTGPGEESIVIRRLTVSTYNAFVRQSPPYNANCTALEFIRENSFRHAAGIQWSHVQGSSAIRIRRGMINTRSLFFLLDFIIDFITQIIQNYPRFGSVETDDEARQPRFVINFLGVPLFGPSRFLLASFFRDQDRQQDANLTNRTNFTAPNNTSTNPQPNGTNNSVCVNLTNCTSNNTLGGAFNNCSTQVICNFNSSGAYICSNVTLCTNGTNCSANITNCTNNTIPQNPTPPVVNVSNCTGVGQSTDCRQTTVIISDFNGVQNITSQNFTANNTAFNVTINQTQLPNGSNLTTNTTNSSSNAGGVQSNQTNVSTVLTNPDGSTMNMSMGTNNTTDPTTGCVSQARFGETKGQQLNNGSNLTTFFFINNTVCPNGTVTNETNTTNTTTNPNGTTFVYSNDTTLVTSPEGSAIPYMIMSEFFVTMTMPNGNSSTNGTSFENARFANGTLMNETATFNTSTFTNGTTENLTNSTANMTTPNGSNSSVVESSNITTSNSSTGANTTRRNRQETNNFTNGTNTTMTNNTEVSSINDTNITSFNNRMTSVNPPNTLPNVTMGNASRNVTSPTQNTSFISQINATNFTNGTIMSSALDSQDSIFANGTNQTFRSASKVDNSTTGTNRTMDEFYQSNLSNNSSVAGSFFLTNTSSENIPNGTNTTNFTLVLSNYDPASRTNTTIQNFTQTINGSNSTTSVNTTHTAGTKKSLHAQIAPIPPASTGTGANVDNTRVLIVVLNDSSLAAPGSELSNNTIRAMNTIPGFLDIQSLELNTFRAITNLLVGVRKTGFRNVTINNLNRTIDTTISNFSDISFAPTTTNLTNATNILANIVNTSTMSVPINATVNNTTVTNGSYFTAVNLTEPNSTTRQYVNTTNVSNSTIKTTTPTDNATRVQTLTNDTASFNVSTFDNTTEPVVVNATFTNFAGSSNSSLIFFNYSNITNVSAFNATNTTMNMSTAINMTYNSFNRSLMSNVVNMTNLTEMNFTNGTNIFMRNFTSSNVNATALVTFTSTSNISNYSMLTIPNTTTPANVTNVTRLTQNTIFNDTGFSLKNVSLEQNISFGLNATNFSFFNISNLDYYERNNATGRIETIRFNRTNSSDFYNNSNNLTARLFSEDIFFRTLQLQPNGTNNTNLTQQKAFTQSNMSNASMTNDTVLNISASGVNASNLDALNMRFARNMSTLNQTNRTNTTRSLLLETNIGRIANLTQAALTVPTFTNMTVTTPNYDRTFLNASINANAYICQNLTQANTTFVNVTGALLDPSTNTFTNGTIIGSNYTLNRTENTSCNNSNQNNVGFNSNTSVLIINNSNQTAVGNNSSELFFNNYTFNNRTEFTNSSQGAQYAGRVVSAAEEFFLSTSPSGSNTTLTNRSTLDFDGNKTVVTGTNTLLTQSTSEPTRTQSLQYATSRYVGSPVIATNSTFQDSTTSPSGQVKTESNATNFNRNGTQFDSFIYNYTRSVQTPGAVAGTPNQENVVNNYRAETVNVIANNSAIKNYTSYNATTLTPADAANVARQVDGFVLEVQNDPFAQTKLVVQYNSNVSDFTDGAGGQIPLATNQPANTIRFTNYSLTRNSTRAGTLAAGDLIYFNTTNTSNSTEFQNPPQAGGVARQDFLTIRVNFEYSGQNNGGSRYRKCDYLNNTNITDYTNGSRLLRYTAEFTCEYNPANTPGAPTNDIGPAGSTVTRRENTYVDSTIANGVIIDAGTIRSQTFSTPRARTENFSILTYSGQPVQQGTTTNPDFIPNAFYLAPGAVTAPPPSPGRRRRLLMENTNKHFQGTTTTVTGGNFIWVSCFTGFGEASLININSIVDNQPTMDNCITRINAERPNFTVERLRVAVNSFLAQNPGAL